jgi:tRNA threonylcarbamoyladenosine biosynthesis protein TsaE
VESALEIVTRAPEETFALGQALGRRLEAGDLVTLSGELGAGKTALAQGVAAGLGVTEPVSSPTFALVHEYRGRMRVWHLDVYRLRGPAELADLCWEDLLQGEGVLLVEWPERIREALPPERLDLALEYVDETRRRIAFLPHGERMERVVAEIGEEGR